LEVDWSTSVARKLNSSALCHQEELQDD